MAEDWKRQLQNEDPRVRAEAIKALAHSGDRANLPYLKDIVENDPDPRLVDYARKAARHLFTSTEESASESAPGLPEKKPVREEKSRATEPQEASAGRDLPPAERTAAETKIQRALSLHMRGDTTKALKAFAQGLDLDPNLANETFTRSVASELTGLHPDQALEILMDPEDRKALLTPPKKKDTSPAERSSPDQAVEPSRPVKPREGLVQTWLSFFSMTEGLLADEADQANTEDTLLSILVFTIAAVVVFVVNGFFQFQRIITLLNQQMALMGEELPPLDFNFGMLFLGMLVITLIMTPLSFLIGAGLQYLGVKLFGGSGDFKSHLYLLALIQVPLTVLGGVLTFLGMVPVIGFVAGLAGFGLAIYGLVVNVRAIKAVHNLPTGRAVAGMIIPPIILAALAGCLLMIFGSALLGLLAGLTPT